MLSFRRFASTLSLTLLLQSPVLLADWRETLPEARMVGGGEMRIFGFAIYDAQLWSAASTPGEAVAMRVPFALQLTYRRSISREDLVAASLKEIRRLAERELDPLLLQRWAREMNAAFVDVQEGDRITGVFLPGEGARFYVGAKLQHVVTDQAFAQAFFAIWLDPRTRNPGLRAQLLGTVRP